MKMEIRAHLILFLANPLKTSSSLASPPWLNSRRAALLLSGFVIVTAAVFGWVFVLRKRVRHQTQVIKTRLANEAALEERYRRVFERKTDRLIHCQGECPIIDCNETCAHILGYPSRNALLQHPQVADRLHRNFISISVKTSRESSAQLVNAECNFQSLDGSSKWVLVNVRLVCKTETAVAFLEAGLVDITENKRAEEALLFKTAMLEAQSETTIDGILVVGEANEIVLVNKQFGRHFEVPNELLETRDDTYCSQVFAG